MVYRKTRQISRIFISLATLITFLFNTLPLSAEDLHLESFRPPQVTTSEIPLSPSFASMDVDASARRLRFIARANRLVAEKFAKNTGFGAKSPSAVQDIAIQIFMAYGRHFDAWQEITSRAKDTFENKDWWQAIHDGEDRVDLYRIHTDLIEKEIRRRLGKHFNDLNIWEQIRQKFKTIILGYYDQDLAMTFFYSVMRRMYLDSNMPVEYDDDGVTARAYSPLRLKENVFKVFRKTEKNNLEQILEQILDLPGFESPFKNKEADIRIAAEKIRAELESLQGHDAFNSITILKSVFYRNKGAYLVGRMKLEDKSIPFVLPLVHEKGGIELDAVLMDDNSVRAVFSQTRANFHVAISHPALKVSFHRELIHFLETILPNRSRADIMSSIGLIHPGKIEFRKNLREHLERTSEQFVFTEGKKGTVMSTFTLPTLDYVFKVISDRDMQRKKPARERAEVEAKYHKVHVEDRIGRFLDTMVFRNLRFRKKDFSSDVFAELKSWAPSVIIDDGDDIIIKHVYAQRKLKPLDDHIEENAGNPDEIRRVLTDLGWLIKDSAKINLWPGIRDLKLRNFGVTSYPAVGRDAGGRVVSYDYDELVSFESRKFVDSIAPVYYPREEDGEAPVGYDSDYIERYVYAKVPVKDILVDLDLPQEYWHILEEEHPQLFQIDYWNRVKGQLGEGKIFNFYPYPAHTRLRKAGFGVAQQKAISDDPAKLAATIRKLIRRKEIKATLEHDHEVFVRVLNPSRLKEVTDAFPLYRDFLKSSFSKDRSNLWLSLESRERGIEGVLNFKVLPPEAMEDFGVFSDDKRFIGKAKFPRFKGHFMITRSDLKGAGSVLFGAIAYAMSYLDPNADNESIKYTATSAPIAEGLGGEPDRFHFSVGMKPMSLRYGAMKSDYVEDGIPRSEYGIPFYWEWKAMKAFLQKIQTQYRFSVQPKAKKQPADRGFGIEENGSTLVITDSVDKIFNALRTRAGRSVLNNPSRIIIAIEDADRAELLSERFYKLLSKFYAVKRGNIMGGGEALLHDAQQVALLKQYGFYYVGSKDKLPIYLESAVHKNNFEITEWAVWLGNALEHELKTAQNIQVAA